MTELPPPERPRTPLDDVPPLPDGAPKIARDLLAAMLRDPLAPVERHELFGLLAEQARADAELWHELGRFARRSMIGWASVVLLCLLSLGVNVARLVTGS